MYTSHSQVLERDDQPGDTFYSAGSAIFDFLNIDITSSLGPESWKLYEEIKKKVNTSNTDDVYCL